MAVQAVTRKTYLNLVTDALREAAVQQEAPTSIDDTGGQTPRFKQLMKQSYIDLQLMADWGWRRKRTEILLPPLARRIDTADRTPSIVLQFDASGPTYTDYTDEADENTASDVVPFGSGVAVGDIFYVGEPDPFTNLRLNVGTAAAGGTPVLTVVWKYYDGSTWTALTGVTDGTGSGSASMGQTGTNEVTWSTSPTDWAKVSLNSSVPYYYISGEVTAVSDVTTDPLLTRVYIDGTEDWETIISHMTDPRGPKYLPIRTLDSKSDLNVVDDDELGKVYYMPYQSWRGEDAQLFSITAGVPTWFTVLPDHKLEFNKPADKDYGITVDYMAGIMEMTADADLPVLPTALQDILVWLCVLNYMGWDEQNAGFANAHRRFMFYLKRMKKDYLPQPALVPFPLFTNYD